MQTEHVEYANGYNISGLEINFFVREPAGDKQKNFGRQIVNFGRQLML